jgi:hypothetical protein
MSKEELSVMNIDRLVKELIESEKYDRALIAARRGIIFIDTMKDNQTATISLVRGMLKVVDHLLSPYYPEEKGNYPFEDQGCYNQHCREVLGS